MKDLFTALANELNRKRDLVLVTIIRNEGSAPQGSGARMLVSLNGLSAGTIGGGAVEYQCIQVAKELIGTTEGRSVSFSLNAKDSANLGMVCGGNLQALFTPVSGQDER